MNTTAVLKLSRFIVGCRNFERKIDLSNIEYIKVSILDGKVVQLKKNIEPSSNGQILMHNVTHILDSFLKAPPPPPCSSPCPCPGRKIHLLNLSIERYFVLTLFFMALWQLQKDIFALHFTLYI